MPKLSKENRTIVKQIVKDVYSGMGIQETLAYIKRTTGLVISKPQLIRIARSVGASVSKETKRRLSAEGNIKNLSPDQAYAREATRNYYRTKGAEYVSELTGKTPEWVKSYANAMGITLSPELRAKKWAENLKKRQENKRGGIIAKLSPVEKLALFKPWGNYVREPRETFMENWPR